MLPSCLTHATQGADSRGGRRLRRRRHRGLLGSGVRRLLRGGGDSGGGLLDVGGRLLGDGRRDFLLLLLGLGILF